MNYRFCFVPFKSPKAPSFSVNVVILVAIFDFFFKNRFPAFLEGGARSSYSSHVISSNQWGKSIIDFGGKSEEAQEKGPKR